MSAVMLACLTLLAAGPACAQGAWASPTSQLSPAGYSGAINTPNADVIPWGGAMLGLTNSNPERPRTLNAGGFGSFNAGLGLLPGLEVVGRLAFEGDLQCNMYGPNCPGQRDLSVSAKYQLPLALPLNSRAALGMTDYGGAATNYRQAYGVITSRQDNMDLTLGYSRAAQAQALMHGVFGSAAWRVTDHLSALAERDTRESRAGLQYLWPLHPAVALQTGVSHKWTRQTGQQANQVQLALLIHLERPTAAAPVRLAPTVAPMVVAPMVVAPAASSVALPASLSAVASPADSKVSELVSGPSASASVSDTVNALTRQLVQAGYAHVQVRYWSATAGQAGHWAIQAESRRWRQNQTEALGHALGIWRALQTQTQAHPDEDLLLTLTYQRQAVLTAHTSTGCLNSWLQGAGHCEPAAAPGASVDQPLRISRRAGDFAHLNWPDAPPTAQASEQGGQAWMPQIEIGPHLQTTVGTEVGLVDYALALEVGAEVALAPGLFWQGAYAIPVSHSGDYGNGKSFADQRLAQSQWQYSQVAWWQALPLGFAGQITAGQATAHEKGAQIDGLWMSANGRWRLGATAGRYTSDQDIRTRQPLLGQVRYSVLPGAWHIEATAGQFLQGDQGVSLASHHWFGDTRFSLMYRRSQSADAVRLPERQFLGFQVSLPIGPRAATSMGPLWLRGRDQWAWGLETKVGDSDNVITRGYGQVPRTRHGLWTDVTDFDRNGEVDLQRLQTLLRQL